MLRETFVLFYQEGLARVPAVVVLIGRTAEQQGPRGAKEHAEPYEGMLRHVRHSCVWKAHMDHQQMLRKPRSIIPSQESGMASTAAASSECGRASAEGEGEWRRQSRTRWVL